MTNGSYICPCTDVKSTNLPDIEIFKDDNYFEEDTLTIYRDEYVKYDAVKN